MATYVVTNTQDTDSQVNPAPADIPGSFKAALRSASADAGGTVAFALPANSTLSLLSFTYPSSVATQAGTINVDFTGAPGLTFASSAAASVPGAFTVLRDYVDMTVTGALKGDASIGYLLSLFSPTATATLNAGSSLSSTSAVTVLNDGGATLTIGANATVSGTGSNALFVNQNYGAVTDQSVTVAAGATVTDSSTGYSAVYMSTNATGATLTNSGTISSSGNAGYVGNSNAALVNTASGVVSSSATSAMQLNQASTLVNAGTVSSSSTGAAVYNVGTGAVTNSGTIASTRGAAYVGTAASTLTNLGGGTITSSAAGASAVQAANGATLVNAGTVSNTSAAANATGVYIAGAGSLTNSGVISTASSNGYAVGVQMGSTVTSTGTISSQAGAYAISGFSTAGSGVTTINLAAGSTTTGNVGGPGSGALAVTVAGSLNGGVLGASAQADALTLVNGLSFNGAISLGGGGDTLTLTGASGSNTLVGASVTSGLALAKSGAGAWVLSGAGANYTGVAFSGGVLELTAANSAGTGAIAFGAGSQTLRLDTTAGQNFALAPTLTGFGVEDLLDVRNTTVTSSAVAGDTLTLTTAAGTTATVAFASGTLSGKAVAIADDGAGGSAISIGAVVAPATVSPGQTTNLNTPGATPNSTSGTTVVNGDVTDNGAAQISSPTPVTYTGSISGTGSLTVAGGSTVTLTGASTYTGATTVSSGVLVVNGSIANSPVTVSSGAVIGGNGTTGALTATNGATVSPGNSPGILNTTANLVLSAGSNLKEEISGVVNASGATTFDQINVTGTASISGAVLNAVLYGGYTPASSGTAAFSIIHTTAGVTGTFAGLPEGATLVIGGQQATISYVGGATHTDVTLQFTGPWTASSLPPAQPTLSASQAAGYAVQAANLLRASASDAAVSDVSSPIYAQVQAEKAIAARLDAGQISAPDAQAALFHLVDGTISVAEISYAFFTGKTPTQAGLNYLVHSAANTSDLNDAYYTQFTVENRYINFAANLATGVGAGASSFQAAYGSLSLGDATAKAYAAVFGVTPTADKVAAILSAQVSNGLGGTETRAQYLSDITGGSAIAQKAAVVGFLLADSVKEGFGLYQQADQHFLQDLAHGSALFNTDLLTAYTQAPGLVGQPVVDPTLGS